MKLNEVQEQQVLQKQHIQTLAKCPFQCGSTETHMHYMEYNLDKSKTKWTLLIGKFKKILTAAGIHDSILRLMIWEH